MTAGTLVLWRHGQTDFNRSMRLQGQSDIALNETGRRQAAGAATALAALLPTRIITSDLVRAADTAQALGDLTGIVPVPDPRLRERRFGAWEGMTRSEIAEAWPAAYAAWRQGHEPEGVGAETRSECGRRVAAAVEEAAADLTDDDVLVVVAHGAAITLGQTVLLGLDPMDWFGLTGLENCAWTIMYPNPGREPAWRLSAYNLGLD
ncbi:histidine phosphatase family protein [Georgenia sp. TF02-10]|uniref:histidine phosphatase family protein n=1 Tax=Georgenia sp. TF02-10 TaxID=2917725 RepID=UPI001FA77351|nr:histidine phosphatase family protein [Georgenia sp. TF02-10]UNX53775.1 histidine phosphatase family protein [Georgenia sp. TF02-10]